MHAPSEEEGQKTVSVRDRELTLLSKDGDSDACLRLGKLYMDGEMVRKDCDRAYTLFEAAGKKDLAGAYYHIGLLFLDKTWQKHSEEKGMTYLQASAKMEYIPAMLALCQLYVLKKRTEENLASALNLSLQADQLESLEGTYWAGVCYLEKNDLDNARLYLEKAAKKGYSPAMSSLYITFMKQGKTEPALKWLEKASELGVPDAQIMLANELWLGESPKKDRKRAVELARAASDAGFTDAQYFLAAVLHHGEKGVLKRDSEQAFSLFIKASQGGHLDAIYQVAMCYLAGLGVERDAEKGMDYLEKAARKGHCGAQYEIAMMLALSGDASKAYVLLSEAFREDKVEKQQKLFDRKSKIADAKTVTEECLKKTPNSPRALGMHALVLTRQGEFPEAEAMYMRALAQSPEDTLLLEQLGDVLGKQNKKSNAVKAWSEAFSLSKETEQRGRLRNKLTKTQSANH